MAKRPVKARRAASPENGPVEPLTVDDRERLLDARERQLEAREEAAAALQDVLAAEEEALGQARLRLETLEQSLLQKEEDLFIQQAALDEARDLATELEAAPTATPSGGDLLDQSELPAVHETLPEPPAVPQTLLEGPADDALLQGPPLPPPPLPAPPAPSAPPAVGPAGPAASEGPTEDERAQAEEARRAEAAQRIKLESEVLLSLVQDLPFLQFVEPRLLRNLKDETLDWPTMAGFYNLVARLMKEELEKARLLLAKTEADSRQELQQKERALMEANAAIVGLQEDFERHRTRTKQEQEGMQARANEELLRQIVPISDNFARALSAAQDATNVEAVVSGVRMIYKLFDDILSREGLIPIPARRGANFNPKVHEALMEVETEEVADDAIYEEVQRGYYLGGKVFRPGLVKVARNPGGVAPAPVEPPVTSPEQ